MRCTSTTPDELNVKVNLPNGESFIYAAKVVKLQNHTKDEIFRKKLLFFLPYYIMRYEKQLNEIANNTEKLQSLLLEYMDIRIQLERVLCSETESVLYADMVKLIIRISNYILKSEEKVMKGVNDAMGGEILELESERLIRIGKAEGKAEGESLLASLITQLFATGRTSDAELETRDESNRFGIFYYISHWESLF